MFRYNYKYYKIYLQTINFISKYICYIYNNLFNRNNNNCHILAKYRL